jgi:phage repressor protein C with HTH and peptisase S24 domain
MTNYLKGNLGLEADPAPCGMDPKWITDQLERTGKSQADLARYLDMAAPQVNKIIKGKRGIKAAEADAIRRFFNVPIYAPSPTVDVRRVDTPTDIPTRSAMQMDVPLLGTAWGGESGDFTMNGETGDYMRRPPRYAGRADLLALFVQGESMQPRYFSGELIYVEKQRPPQNGDHVVVELLPDEGGVCEAYLKQLVSITPTKIRLQQYNPAKIIEIERRKIGQILRVLSMMDLLGS